MDYFHQSLIAFCSILLSIPSYASQAVVLPAQSRSKGKVHVVAPPVQSVSQKAKDFLWEVCGELATFKDQLRRVPVDVQKQHICPELREFFCGMS